MQSRTQYGSDLYSPSGILLLRVGEFLEIELNLVNGVSTADFFQVKISTPLFD